MDRVTTIREVLWSLGLRVDALERELKEDYAWLDGVTTINEDLATDLLGDIFQKYDVPLIFCSRFVQRYNAFVRKGGSTETRVRDSTYREIVNIVKEVGSEGVAPECDFWVVEDSFSDDSIVVISFKGMAELQLVCPQLQEALDRQRLFRAIEINDEEGRNLFRLERTKR